MCPSVPIDSACSVCGLPPQQLVGHALEGLADHHELGSSRRARTRADLARTEVEVAQPPGAPTVPPLGGEHDQVERVHRLHLAPRRAAPARLVRRVERLHEHALVAVAVALSAKRSASSASSVSIDGSSERAGTVVAQQRLALHERLVDQRGAVEVEHVEEERVGRAEAAHRVLEPARSARPRRAPATRRRARSTPTGSARTTSTTFGSAGVMSFSPRVNSRTSLAGLVRLHADAVELPLDARQARQRPRPRRPIAEVAASIGCTATSGLRPTSSDSPRERPLRRLAEIAEQHRGAAHVGGGDAGGLGDGVAHHAVVGTLAQLAGQEAHAGGAARRRSCRPSRARSALLAGALRAGAGGRREIVDGAVDVADAQIARVRAAGSTCASRIVAHPTPMRPCGGSPTSRPTSGDHLVRARPLGAARRAGRPSRSASVSPPPRATPRRPSRYSTTPFKPRCSPAQRANLKTPRARSRSPNDGVVGLGRRPRARARRAGARRRRRGSATRRRAPRRG